MPTHGPALAVTIEDLGVHVSRARRWPSPPWTGSSLEMAGGLVHGGHRPERHAARARSCGSRRAAAADGRARCWRRTDQRRGPGTVGSGSSSSSRGSSRGARPRQRRRCRSSWRGVRPPSAERAGEAALEREVGLADAAASASARAVGRDAAARRAGPGAGQRPGGPAPRRAVQRPRRPDARAFDAQLAALWLERRRTVVLVTHSVTEAVRSPTASGPDAAARAGWRPRSSRSTCRARARPSCVGDAGQPPLDGRGPRRAGVGPRARAAAVGRGAPEVAA